MIWVALGGCVAAMLWLVAAMRGSRARRRLVALERTAHDVLWTVDRQGRIVHISGSCREVYGLRPRNMIGRQLTEFVAADFAEQERTFLARVVKSRETIHHETVHEHKDGTRAWLAVNAVGNGSGATGCARNVTHVRDLERRLVRTERMHAIGALAGGVAHDFKNLLTVISGQAEFASQSATPAVERRMAAILKTAERGRSMVEELLVFARNQNQRHEVLELCDVVSGIEEMLQRLLRDGIRLEMRLPKASVYVRADRGKLEQIVMNLVINAQDASPDGGAVSIRVASGRLDIERTRELGIDPGLWAVLQVIDHGEGMDEEVLSQVFDPFYTTKGEGRGTGLGLATVQGIVHQYGGAVAARSVPGRGTRMSVLLPLVQRGDAALDDEQTDSDVRLPSRGALGRGSA